jgi:hypothetical protein
LVSFGWIGSTLLQIVSRIPRNRGGVEWIKFYVEKIVWITLLVFLLRAVSRTPVIKHYFADARH